MIPDVLGVRSGASCTVAGGWLKEKVVAQQGELSADNGDIRSRLRL
jgi:hypothetical protein